MTTEQTHHRARLAATLAALGDSMEGLAWLSANEFGAVQLSAAQPGLRPRELDGAARRGLREQLRRLELEPSGIDLWIPVAHFASEAEVARAIDAMVSALALAEFLGRVPLSCVLPGASMAVEARRSIVDEAARRGVAIADFAEDAVVEGPVGFGVDQALCQARGVSMVEAIVRAASNLVAVRLGEHGPGGSRRPVAEGSRAAEELLSVKATLEIGLFRGIAVADARAWPDPRSGLLATRAAWNASAIDPRG